MRNTKNQQNSVVLEKACRSFSQKLFCKFDSLRYTYKHAHLRSLKILTFTKKCFSISISVNRHNLISFSELILHHFKKFSIQHAKRYSRCFKHLAESQIQNVRTNRYFSGDTESKYECTKCYDHPTDTCKISLLYRVSHLPCTFSIMSKLYEKLCTIIACL